MHDIEKIVSGGQTGVDRAALDAAREYGVPYGGWVPKGRRTEDGVLGAEYAGMRETESESYAQRTMLNVVESDATLIFNMGELDGGTQKTVELCVRHGKPYAIQKLDRVEESLVWMPVMETGDLIRELRARCKKDRIVLNVAGPRESKRPGIYRRAHGTLTCMFSFGKIAEDLATWRD